jgi:hypothetical protein
VPGTQGLYRILYQFKEIRRFPSTEAEFNELIVQFATGGLALNVALSTASNWCCAASGGSHIRRV